MDTDDESTSNPYLQPSFHTKLLREQLSPVLVPVSPFPTIFGSYFMFFVLAKVPIIDQLPALSYTNKEIESVIIHTFKSSSTTRVILTFA